MLSVRQIGEGHRSSIGFRSVVVGADGDGLDRPRGPYTDRRHDRGRHARRRRVRRSRHRRRRRVRAVGARWPRASASRRSQLTERLQPAGGAAGHAPRRRRARRRGCRAGGALLRASGSRRRPSSTSACSSRPAPPSPTASRTPGSCASSMRRHDHVHATTRRTTGRRSPSSCSATTDFETFTSFAAARRRRREQGPGAVPATDRRPLPRTVPVRRRSATRSPCPTTSAHWPTSTPLDVRRPGVELGPVGNCGSPIELDEGWLVLTHGVGAMRTYSIGALLLDLDDPQRRHRPDRRTAPRARGPTNGTATCPTSSTRAARCATATPRRPLRHRRQPDRLRHVHHRRRPRRHARRPRQEPTDDQEVTDHA